MRSLHGPAVGSLEHGTLEDAHLAQEGWKVCLLYAQRERAGSTNLRRLAFHPHSKVPSGLRIMRNQQQLVMVTKPA